MVEFVDLSSVRNETDPDSIAARIRFRVIRVLATDESISYIGDWDAENVLVATPHGLRIVNHRTFLVTPPPSPPASGIRLDTIRVADFCWETPDRLWLGTYSHGLFLLDRARWSLTSYPKGPEDRSPSPEDHITEISFDDHGRLWVGRVRGLDLFDPVERRYLDYLVLDVPRPSDVYYMNVDAAGTFWITTRQMSVFYLTARSFRIPHYGLLGENGRPLAMETIHSNTDGTFWISSEGKALLVDLASFRVLRTVDIFRGRKPTYGRAGVFDSYRSPSGVIWYGTWGLGLYRFDPRTGSVANFRSSTQLTDSYYRTDIC
jgi:ligand-binding sensor domain-containing protein